MFSFNKISNEKPRREVFTKTIISFMLIGYEAVKANSALRTSLAIITLYPMRTHEIIIVKYSLIVY